MILYQVKASRLLFICKVQNLTCPQSFSHNAHSRNRRWCPHTPCAMSHVQNHPARGQATHWDEINNTKEITVLVCLSFSSALISLQFLSSILSLVLNILLANLRLHTKQVRSLLSNALHVTRIQWIKPKPSRVLGTAGSVMNFGLSLDAHTRKTSLKGVGCFWPIFIFVVVSTTFKCIVSACRGWHVLRHTSSTSTSTEKTILTSPEVQSATTSKRLQPEPAFLLLSQEEDKKRLCAQGG